MPEILNKAKSALGQIDSINPFDKIFSGPQGNEGQSIANNMKMIDEYKRAQQPMTEPQGTLPVIITPMDMVAHPPEKYGDRPGEERIDVNDMLKPLGTLATPQRSGMTPITTGNHMPVYDKGGEVNPGDGDHEMAILEKGERVLTPQQNADYEKNQHGFKQIERPKDMAPSVVINMSQPMQDAEGLQMGSLSGKKMPKEDSNPKVPLYDGGGVVGEGDAQQVPIPLTPEQQKQKDTNKQIRQVIEDKQIQAADKGDIMGVGLGAIAHNQLDKHDERNGTTAVDKEAVNNAVQAPPTMPVYSGPSKTSVPQGSAIPSIEMPQDIKNYQKTPEGKEKAESDLQMKKLNLQSKQSDLNLSPTERDQARADLVQLERNNPWGSPGNHPGALGKLGHIASEIGQAAGMAVIPQVIMGLPGTRTNLGLQEAGAQEAVAKDVTKEKEQAATELEKAQARIAGQKTPSEAFYLYATRGGPNGTPAINPDTDKPYTPEEALQASKAEGTQVDAVGIRDLQKKINPETQQPYTHEEAAEAWFKLKNGTKMNDNQRKVADWMASHQMEDTPENRNTARQAVIAAETAARDLAGLPAKEQYARFNQTITQENNRLTQQNADANTRGLKADELQNTENIRFAKSTTQIKGAQDALAAADDEQLAANIVPLLSTLAVVSTEGGVKRLNRQELERFLPADGNLIRWAESHVDKFLLGEIPDDYKNEVGSMLTRMSAAETAEHQIITNSIDSTVRQGAQQPIQKPGGGAAETPAPSTPQAPTEKAKEQKEENKIPDNAQPVKDGKGNVVGYQTAEQKASGKWSKFSTATK